MNGYILAITGATVLGAGVISWAMTRRYGRTAAALLPLLALAASIGLTWRAEGLGLNEGASLVFSAMIYSAPAMLGAIIGILIGSFRRK